MQLTLSLTETNDPQQDTVMLREAIGILLEYPGRNQVLLEVRSPGRSTLMELPVISTGYSRTCACDWRTYWARTPSASPPPPDTPQICPPAQSPADKAGFFSFPRHPRKRPPTERQRQIQRSDNHMVSSYTRQIEDRRQADSRNAITAGAGTLALISAAATTAAVTGTVSASMTAAALIATAGAAVTIALGAIALSGFRRG